MIFFRKYGKNYMKDVSILEEIHLTENDMLLLEELQINCRRSLKDMAKRVKMPMSTVHEKIKRFEKAGLILGYRTLLDEKKLGFDITAFIMASTKYITGDRYFQRNLGEKVASLPHVLEVHTMQGDWDLLIKVKFKNVQELGKFVDEK